MALFDAMFELDDALDLSTHTATEVESSTNVIDWVNTDLEMGAGSPFWLNVRVGTAFGSSGSATLQVELMRETDTTIDASSNRIWATGLVPLTALTAGEYIIRMPLPYNVDEDRYTGLLYTIGTAAMTAGTVDAWVDNGPSSSYDVQVSASNI